MASLKTASVSYTHLDVYKRQGILYGMRRSGITQDHLYVEGRRIPLQPGKLITQKEQDGYLQLYYELGIHFGTLIFSIDKKEQIDQILKNQGY